MSRPPRSETPIALTIAGSDSGGGAGIQADLKTFAHHRVHGLSAITALTAQSTVEVRAVHAVPIDFIRTQVETLLDDFTIDAVKTGMLGTAAIVETVAALLDRIDAPKVIDPVMVASSGARLLDEGAVSSIMSLLLPRATLVTPNLFEVEVMIGERPRDRAEMIDAARTLVARGARAALVKGGHLESDDLVDVLFDGEPHVFEGARIATMSTHGTGCSYAASIAAHLAKGCDLVEAVRESHAWLRRAIASAPKGIGRGAGPIDHFRS